MLKIARRIWSRILPLAFVVVGQPMMAAAAERNGLPYNFVFIAVDDLNDWTGFLGGHPQTKTPNMDKLAREGMVFERAFCPASLCNPCRAAVLTGYRPSSSGVYENENFMRESVLLQNAPTLPQWLSAHGYFTMARGKIFHHADGIWADPKSWDLHATVQGRFGKLVTAPEPGLRASGLPLGAIKGAFWDWGATEGRLEETPDYLSAKWAGEQLQRDHQKPFFLACGIFRPHLPWFVPKAHFEKFPKDGIQLPEINANDYDDIPASGFKPSDTYFLVEKNNKREEAVQAYLASVNYADACIGVLLDALAKSKYADNTIVVLWGDHGWHLGEKLRLGKATLWDESIRVPLIIKVPGMTESGSRCVRTVNLIDLYPTIVELAGVPPNSTNEGMSIVPLLKNVRQEWNHPSLTTMGEGNHSVRSEQFHYIRYKSGAEELYDNRADPLEWTNLAGMSEYSDVKKLLGNYVPKRNASEIARKN